MCTAYKVGKKRGAANQSPGAKWVDDDLGEDRLMRPTDSGVVAMRDGSLVKMRWGFERSWSNAIVNAREDKLKGIWSDAFLERRCLIPMTSYFEWGGSRGRRQTYEFLPATSTMLWVAGIWEEHQTLGRCYNMVTTTPNRMVSAYHSRMPALLSQDQLEGYLDGKLLEFSPAESLLEVREVASPLKSDPLQGELW